MKIFNRNRSLSPYRKFIQNINNHLGNHHVNPSVFNRNDKIQSLEIIEKSSVIKIYLALHLRYETNGHRQHSDKGVMHIYVHFYTHSHTHSTLCALYFDKLNRHVRCWKKFTIFQTDLSKRNSRSLDIMIRRWRFRRTACWFPSCSPPSGWTWTCSSTRPRKSLQKHTNTTERCKTASDATVPITELVSVPKAQMHGGPFGIVNLQNDQFDEKYCWKNGALASDDCLLSLGSSRAKMWIVPWSEDTQMNVESRLKLMQYTVAWKRKSSRDVTESWRQNSHLRDAPSDFGDFRPAFRLEHPDQGALLAGRRQARPLQV